MFHYRIKGNASQRLCVPCKITEESLSGFVFLIELISLPLLDNMFDRSTRDQRDDY